MNPGAPVSGTKRAVFIALHEIEFTSASFRAFHPFWLDSPMQRAPFRWWNLLQSLLMHAKCRCCCWRSACVFDSVRFGSIRGLNLWPKLRARTTFLLELSFCFCPELVVPGLDYRRPQTVSIIAELTVRSDFALFREAICTPRRSGILWACGHLPSLGAEQAISHG